MLAGPLGVHIGIIVVAIVLAVKEQVNKLCNAADSNAIMKDITSGSRKLPLIDAQIYSLAVATTILQSRYPWTKMLLAKTIPGTKPLTNYQLNIVVAVFTVMGAKYFTSEILCFDTGVVFSLVSKK